MLIIEIKIYRLAIHLQKENKYNRYKTILINYNIFFKQIVYKIIEKKDRKHLKISDIFGLIKKTYELNYNCLIFNSLTYPLFLAPISSIFVAVFNEDVVNTTSPQL